MSPKVNFKVRRAIRKYSGGIKLLEKLDILATAASGMCVSECLLNGFPLVSSSVAILARRDSDKGVTRLLSLGSTIYANCLICSVMVTAGMMTWLIASRAPMFKVLLQ